MIQNRLNLHFNGVGLSATVVGLVSNCKLFFAIVSIMHDGADCEKQSDTYGILMQTHGSHVRDVTYFVLDSFWP